MIQIFIFVLIPRFYLPKDSQHTKGGIRGWKPWFTDRQVQIAVTRIIRDDPAKRYYQYVYVPQILVHSRS